MVNDPPSTLKPAEVAEILVQHAVAKHKDRYDKVFFKAVSLKTLKLGLHVINGRSQFMAGAMLSFGGLLSEVLQGGATGLNASNPGIVKVLGGFVFPVGLVMFGVSMQSSA
jgi:formate/nitrite transporter FocA (FNT family)